MKPYIYTLVLATLIAVQLTGCKSSQTYSYNKSQVVYPVIVDSRNVCNYKNAKTQQKCLACYNYVQDLKKSYGIKTVEDTTSGASNIAAAPYLLIKGGK